jgi:hypothetical protein
MDPTTNLLLVKAILALHVAVIGFNVAGLFLIPIGAWRGWRWVRAPLWRLAHLGSWAVVALQAALGRACFLTDWQDGLTGASGREPPLVMRWVNSLVYWPLPLWMFAVLYAAAFAYVVALLWWVRLRRL